MQKQSEAFVTYKNRSMLSISWENMSTHPL